MSYLSLLGNSISEAEVEEILKKGNVKRLGVSEECVTPNQQRIKAELDTLTLFFSLLFASRLL